MHTPKQDSLLTRLENLPPAQRLTAIEAQDQLGTESKEFLLQHYRDMEAVAQATFHAGQRLRMQSAGRSAVQPLYDFELEEEIGRGATSTVWKAQDRRLGTTVALKLFELLDARRHKARQRVLREAQAASRVISNHVVRIRDVGELDDGTPFIAMELCAEVPDDGSSAGLRDIGRNLATEGPRSLEEAVRLMAQAARGISDAHREGVYHRDLKPANILCRPQARRAEVIDFGLAVPELMGSGRHGQADGTVSVVIQDEAGRRIVLAGTPPYMAPEQAQGLPAVAESSDDRERLIRADIYGLGATLYALIAGHAPYRPRPQADDNALDVIRQVLAGPPPSLRTIPTTFKAPPRLVRIIEKAMAPQPADRFRSAKQFADALSAYLEDRPTPVDSGLSTRIWLWLKRNKTMVRTATGLLLMSSVFAAVWLMSVQRFVKLRASLTQTVLALEERRKDLRAQNATLTKEKAALSQERDSLKSDLRTLQTITATLHGIEETILKNHKSLEWRQRKIKDAQLTPEAFKNELDKTVLPVAAHLDNIEKQLHAKVTKEEMQLIRLQLQAIQHKLSAMATLEKELHDLKRQLKASATSAELQPLAHELAELKRQLGELKNNPTPPAPVPHPAQKAAREGHGATK